MYHASILTPEQHNAQDTRGEALMAKEGGVSPDFFSRETKVPWLVIILVARRHSPNFGK